MLVCATPLSLERKIHAFDHFVVPAFLLMGIEYNIRRENARTFSRKLQEWTEKEEGEKGNFFME